MADFRLRKASVLFVSASLFALGACSGGFDVDMRDLSGGFDTTDATRLATERRPNPDARGVITYPNFQVAVAQEGDTIASIAQRLGVDPNMLAKHNGIGATVPLRKGEVIALPGPVGTGAGANGTVDINSLASGALDRAGTGTVRPPSSVTTTTLDPAPAPASAAKAQPGPEPVRHKVVRGETAYSIARLYNVSVRSLADWNGMDSQMTVREGQYLLVPVATAGQPERAAPLDTTSAPGQGSTVPEPPSASRPLPEESEVASAAPPPSPDLSKERTAESGGRLMMPVSGSIIRPFNKGKNDGVDIGAAAGTKVRAADDGTVAAITRDTDQVPILVIRHADNLLTVYANIQNIAAKKGDKVTRGQAIAEVRDSSPSFLHFEVREGFESVDPVPYVN
ncbi:peptidoglycan DD-metalloendopeptidase family protein [Pseudoruegeria sp. HB172150]|uniref:peptidoglycan DD-metalloendopeptidase family protein n=1 Tax=Pseudoruegeria sp. HB172150 TaxID=2721164 RepID=UPI001556352B|nr:peptidoglycan DD-metalloendopeptidase family protein [Pseudoruegeria sp. HB172150]